MAVNDPWISLEYQMTLLNQADEDVLSEKWRAHLRDLCKLDLDHIKDEQRKLSPCSFAFLDLCNLLLFSTGREQSVRLSRVEQTTLFSLGPSVYTINLTFGDCSQNPCQRTLVAVMMPGLTGQLL